MKDDQDDEAPPPEAVAELLKERHRIDRTFTLTVELRGKDRRLAMMIRRPKAGGRPEDIIEIDVALVGGPRSWDLVVDALDALVGTLVENDYAHRDVPSGPDLVFGDGTFAVRVEYRRPDLDELADRLLGKP